MDEYKLEEHRFHKHKSIPWFVCSSCGLINLSNRLSDWCKDKGCNYKDHASFTLKVKQWSNL